MAKPSEIEQRILDVRLTDDEVAQRTGMNVNIVHRITHEGMVGQARDQLVAQLDSWERDGLPPLPPARYEVELDRARSEGTREGQLRVAQERAARVAALKAQWATEAASRRAELEQKLRDAAVARVDLGLELVRLREASGLTQGELAAIAGIRDPTVLSRLEHGRPVGMQTAAIQAVYRAAARMAGGAGAEATGPKGSPARPDRA